MTSTANFIKGIDVSHLQGEINWQQVANDSIQFSYIKATEGASFVDPHYQENSVAAKQHLHYSGCYHFFRPQDNPTEQAKLFLLSANFEEGDLIPVLDAEVFKDITLQRYQTNIRIWLQIVTLAIGKMPMIYSSPNFINQYITTRFSTYPLWIARWAEQPTPLPDGWQQWTCWQYSATGKVAGIDTAVDLDYFQKDKIQQFTLQSNDNQSNVINSPPKEIIQIARDILKQKAQTKKLSDFERHRIEILL